MIFLVPIQGNLVCFLSKCHAFHLRSKFLFNMLGWALFGVRKIMSTD